MKSCRLYIKKEYPDSIIPTKAHEDDACYDLYVARTTVVRPGYTQLVQTSVRIMVEPGWEGLIRGRSGLRSKKIEVHYGTIDAYYTGTLAVIVHNHSNVPYEFKPGDRIAQLAIRPVPNVELIEVDEFPLPPDERGDAGFGSTGR